MAQLMIEKAKVRDVWLMIMDARKKNEEDRKRQGPGSI
jgi:hypothetical protein